MTGPIAIDGPTELSCDVLVIGSGAGGASVAATLAAANVDVLIVEEGPYVRADEAPTTLSESMPALWRGAGLTATLGATPIAFAEGRCVGGGTEINSGIFQPAPDVVVEQWSRTNGLAALTPQGLVPYFARAAAAVHASATAGPGGPPTAQLQRAGETMGWQVTPLERARREGPASRHRISGMADGTKQSMTMTLLPKAFGHGARLLPRCRIHHLQRQGRRVVAATAVAADQAGLCHRVTISASTVFMCAGATQTPALLQRSRIGRNIGATLQIHPTVRVLARFPEPVDAARHHLPLVAITEFSPELRLGGSVFTLATFGLSLAEDWAMRGVMLPDHRYFSIYYAMIRPDGVGRVRSVPGLVEPVVSYRLTERDWWRLGQGLERLSRGLFGAGAVEIVPSIRRHPGWKTPAELQAHPPIALPRSATALMTVHLFGSCPMGGDAALFPVDDQGRLRDTDNVFVADASALPGAPGVNPQATIMAFAFRTAETFLASMPR